MDICLFQMLEALFKQWNLRAEQWSLQFVLQTKLMSPHKTSDTRHCVMPFVTTGTIMPVAPITIAPMLEANWSPEKPQQHIYVKGPKFWDTTGLVSS